MESSGGLEDVKTLASCEGGILPCVGTRAAAGPWLVGVPQPTSWLSQLLPNKSPSVSVS